MTNNNSDPLQLDFAALRTLQVVHRSVSFTHAAEQLGVNQSAVSYTVDRLRKTFNDPLFVRQGGKQVATQRCGEIVRQTSAMLENIHELARPEGFDPARAEETIRIACNYYERVLLVPQIVSNISRAAPRMKIEIVDARGTGHLRLLDMNADVLIGPFLRKESGFYSRTLLQDSYVCLMDKSHDLARKNISLEEYLSLAHIHISYGGNWRSAYLTRLQEMNIELDAVLTVPSPAGIEQLVRGTSLVATIPERLAHNIAQNLVSSICPVRGEFEIGLTWTARTHSSAMFKWVRNMIVRTVYQLKKVESSKHRFS